MTDQIAFRKVKEGYQILFGIDEIWWPLFWNGRPRVYPSKWGAWNFLRNVAWCYEEWYGESLGWDVDSIPVLGGK